MGEYIFSNMFGPILDTFLNHYVFSFYMWSPFPGQNTYDIFDLDYRNTQSPYIGDGFINFYYLGELMYKKQGCTIEPDFMNFSNEEAFSQWVISESAATCMANSLARSNIGHVHLNKEKLTKLFNKPDLDVEFNSSSIAKHIPMFQEKIGSNQPLKLELSFKDVSIKFGQFDTDVVMEYTMGLDFALDQKDSESLFKDELKMITSFNMQTVDDKMMINVLMHKMNIDSKYG